MKIGFFGTPDIAAWYLSRLSESYDVRFAVTGEDKPRGRHGTPTYCEAKDTAIAKGIPVLQPAGLLDEKFMSAVSKENADIFVVVAYGKIIPPGVFNIPPLRTINIHPSLLPKYRGAAPMQWALINGESETGITIQYINEKLDAGDILLQRKMSLPVEMNAAGFMEAVLPLGYEMLQEVLSQLPAGKAVPVKQNENDATYCGKIDRKFANIDWNKSALEIHNLVRGLNPRPVAWTEFRGKIIKVYKTKLAEDTGTGLKPGFIEKNKRRLLSGTGRGCLEILELQPEAKKTMDGISFINGHRIIEGDFFGN